MTFHNRTGELDDVAHVLASSRSELIIVYGRRGVGKSALLAEALGLRPYFYYQATTGTLPQQLEDMTSALRDYASDVILPGVLPSFDRLLDALSQLARRRPESALVVVIDELPYLAQADPSVPTVLQRWWDGIRREGLTGLKVFLLGSLVSWMEEHTLAGRGPLHNRRTGQLRLEPLGYVDAALFYPRFEPESRIGAYAIWGGLPTYLEAIRPEISLWENVRDGVLRASARLAEEAAWLRFADLRNDALYASILRAIAHGERRPSRIAMAVGKSRADEVAFPIERLCEMRLVQRVVPIHQTRLLRSRQALYLLADHYVAFWYRFVDPLRHLLRTGRYDDALTQIQQRFDLYVSAGAFEDVCRQALWRAYAEDRLSSELRFEEVGSWWGGRGAMEDQIDVVAARDGRAVLVGECKWSRQPVGRRELEGLDAALRKARDDLNPHEPVWRALFSRSGFTPELVELARDPQARVLLFSPADLYEIQG